MNPLPQTFWAPKAGNSEAEYEDAFSVAPSVIAIADGATESSFAGLWARALVSGATSGTMPERDDADHVAAWTNPLQEAWRSQVPWDRLPWYAEEKTRQGAFATLLVLTLSSPPLCKEKVSDVTSEASVKPEEETAWRAMAIGDSCLFQVCGEDLVASFPLERADQFDSRPILLSANPANNGAVWSRIHTCTGRMGSGDVLFLMTDALAKWFLAEYESGNKPWQELLCLTTQEEFLAKITSLRENHAMRNDDVTLVTLQYALEQPSTDVVQPMELHIVEPFE